MYDGFKIMNLFVQTSVHEKPFYLSHQREIVSFPRLMMIVSLLPLHCITLSEEGNREEVDRINAEQL